MLEAWCDAARHSDLEPFAKVARTFTDNARASVNAIHLGVNNARIEAMNSTVRLMSHPHAAFAGSPPWWP